MTGFATRHVGFADPAGLAQAFSGIAALSLLALVQPPWSIPAAMRDAAAIR